MKDDITIGVLRDIRTELQGLRTSATQTNEALARTNAALAEGLAKTNDGLAKTNDGLAKTNEALAALERRQTATEILLATEIIAVAGAVRELRDVLVEDRALRAQVVDHEQRIGRLEGRTG
jgi:uncharacterized phage infection (PIP) family protein YhgE